MKKIQYKDFMVGVVFVLSGLFLAIVIIGFLPVKNNSFDCLKSELVYKDNKYYLEVDDDDRYYVYAVSDETALSYIHCLEQDIPTNVVNEMFELKNDSLIAK